MYYKMLSVEIFTQQVLTQQQDQCASVKYTV